MSNSRTRSAVGAALVLSTALVPVVLVGACGGTVGNGVGAGCVSGQQIGCACIGGSQGVQRCDDTGRYGACFCDGFGASTPSPSSPPSSGFGPSESAPPSSTPSATPSPPPGSGKSDDVSACAGSGNVLMFDGDADDFIHPGYELITGAYWTANASPAHDDVSFDIEPGPGQTFSWWNPEVHSPQMSGALMIGAYPNASRAAFTSPIQAGMDISGDGRGCNTISGTFWIHEISWNGDALAHVLLAFEQHCEDGVSALRGCIAYTAAPVPAADAGP